jgi:Mg-chelatase subunit ChlD
MITSMPSLELDARPERRLIRPYGSYRHVHFHVTVASVPEGTRTARAPLTIGLVLDRSGSMHGEKLATARMAALAVLDRLTDQDRVGAVVFDHVVDVLQEGVPATPDAKARLRRTLSSIEARGRTALHEGWLIGCRIIAPESVASDRLSRCFLLTDGLANVGLIDPEQIAAEAAAVRANAGIGTSTFGVGLDYDEALLGPVAVAGGGQFHHLRRPSEIHTTFLGELGELLVVAARSVQLEIEASPGTAAELISPFWLTALGDNVARWSVALGDLLAGEQRDVVMRFGFLNRLLHGDSFVRARLCWVDAGGERSSEWQEVHFELADDAMRGAERADPAVQLTVGLHHAERAQRMAVELSRGGDIQAARQLLHTVAGRISEYSAIDPRLEEAVGALESAARDLEQQGYSPARAKEAYFSLHVSGRGSRDLRGPATTRDP